MDARTILHVDLDAFYASVEQRDDPRLRGLPVIVGWPSKRGVVCAASYEARPFGVHSAMPMGRAMALCPQAKVIAPRMSAYAEASRGFFGILEQCSPLVEGLSLDEAFLDATGSERLFGDGPTLGRSIKQRVRDSLGLVASVGVAPSKFVAKIASDLGKPDGLLVVPDGTVRNFLHPLPIGRLWGVGQVTEKHLAAIGLRTIGDVARIGERALAPRIGANAARHLSQLADGLDDRPVVSERQAVSVGHEETFEDDLRDRARLALHLLAQTDETCGRLRADGLRGRTVMIKVKYADFDLVTRRVTLDRPTSDAQVVYATARRLLEEVPAIEERGVRLTGVALTGLSQRDGRRQLLLDEPRAERGEKLGETLDGIAKKFGRGKVQRAALLDGEAERERTPLSAPKQRPRGRGN